LHGVAESFYDTIVCDVSMVPVFTFMHGVSLKLVVVVQWCIIL